MSKATNLPPIVSPAAWQAAHEELLAKEKAATRARDALAAERRRQPMVKIDKKYVFEGPDQKASLLDSSRGAASSSSITSCSAPARAAGRTPAAPAARWSSIRSGISPTSTRDTSFVLVSIAPVAKIEAYRKRMGWTIPWFSSAGTTFNKDFGRTTEEGNEIFGLSIFLRDGDDVYRTYFTGGRGVEALGSVWSYLDLTPFGRQEAWEESPNGWPQTEPYTWWRRHDEYGKKPSPT